MTKGKRAIAKKHAPTKKAVAPIVAAPQATAPGLTWQGALKLVKKRVFKIRTPQGHGTGFHIGNFGTDRNMCAVATAFHVIQNAYDWGEPIKLIHAESGREILVKETDRAILTYANKDLAVVLFNLPHDFNLDVGEIDLIPTGNYLVAGVDVAWCGFPAVKNDTLCFFHGYISCYLDPQSDYLIDGVAIHGVSGGPVFYIDILTNTPKIAGVITQYIANRATGEALPGVSMITSIAPCEETIRSLRNIDQARAQAETQNQTDDEDTNPAISQ